MTKTTRMIRRDDKKLLDGDGALMPLVDDLLTMAGHAFLADRDERRGPSPDDPRWRRNLHITVPVYDPQLWSNPSVHSKLRHFLEWLTDDTWAISFVPRKSGALARQLSLSLDDVPREVMLFSGGLDAVAGAALLMPRTPLLAVGVVTNHAMRGYQRRAVGALRGSRLGDIGYLPVDFAAVSIGQKDDEPTRRTRGLVFLAVGVAAVLQKGGHRLIVCENGIGAINLPFTLAQSGVMTSRGAHPLTLRLMAQMIESLTGAEFSIENPHVGMTKGEMVSAVPGSAESACAASESCDNAAAGRGALERRCGHCTSCLLRRLSFSAAGRSHWDNRPYLSDSKRRENRWQMPEMLWQVATLDRSLRSPGGEGLPASFPDLRDIPADVLSDSEQRRLFETYVDEWRRSNYPDVELYLDAGHSMRSTK